MKELLLAIRRQPYYYHLPFFAVVLFQLLTYNYFSLMDELPLSAHMWRQTDCLSFTLNYFQNGMHFWFPQAHQVLDGNGYTAAEFPGMYYFVAFLYKIVGPSESVYRLTWTIIMVLGLYALYRNLLLLIKDQFWAIGVTALLFCSPVLVFYGNSFIIDPISLCFLLFGSYFLTRYVKGGKFVFSILSIFFFSLAGLFKETALVFYIALIAVLALRWVILSFQNHSVKWTDLVLATTYLIPFVLVYAYYEWKVDYNLKHYNIMFLSTIRPIWELQTEQISNIVKNIQDYWWEDYFDGLTLYFTAVLFLVNGLLIKRNPYYFLFTLALLLGIISFVLLFFIQFNNHDYYVILLLPIIPAVWVNFIQNLKTFDISRKTWLGVKVVFSVMLFLNIQYAGTIQKKRYTTDKYYQTSEVSKYYNLRAMDQELSRMGIDRHQKVISLPDYTTNHTLYLLNRPGWTFYYRYVGYGSDQIRENIEMGAKYLVINDSLELKKEYVQPFIHTKVAEKGGITVFKLAD